MRIAAGVGEGAQAPAGPFGEGELPAGVARVLDSQSAGAPRVISVQRNRVEPRPLDLGSLLAPGAPVTRHVRCRHSCRRLLSRRSTDASSWICGRLGASVWSASAHSGRRSLDQFNFCGMAKAPAALIWDALAHSHSRTRRLDIAFAT